MASLADKQGRLDTLLNELATLKRLQYTQTISLDMYRSGSKERDTLTKQLASTNQTISEISPEIEQLQTEIAEENLKLELAEHEKISPDIPLTIVATEVSEP